MPNPLPVLGSDEELAQEIAQHWTFGEPSVKAKALEILRQLEAAQGRPDKSYIEALSLIALASPNETKDDLVATAMKALNWHAPHPVQATTKGSFSKPNANESETPKPLVSVQATQAGGRGQYSPSDLSKLLTGDKACHCGKDYGETTKGNCANCGGVKAHGPDAPSTSVQALREALDVAFKLQDEVEETMRWVDCSRDGASKQFDKTMRALKRFRKARAALGGSALTQQGKAE